MVDFVPPVPGGPPTGATMSTFRVAGANGGPPVGPTAQKTRMGGIPLPSMNGAQPNGGGIPLSARKAQALDLATVERRGYVTKHITYIIVSCFLGGHNISKEAETGVGRRLRSFCQ